MGELAIKLPEHKPEDKGFKPYQLGDYTVTQPLTSNKSGFSKWGFCTKDGTEYFIKEFLTPVYPVESIPLAADIRSRKIKQCIDWYEEKKQVYNAIVSAQSGNLVVPVSFFKKDSHFYLVTQKVVSSAMNFELLSKTDLNHKLIIMKVLADSFAMLAEKHIVHADVKPDNLLIKQTNSNFYTMKVIDFDGSYLEDQPPEPDDIQGDPVYYAPETFLYLAEEPVKLTGKVDVFAMGLIYHQLLCGELPGIDSEYDYIYEAVLNDAEIRLSDAISPFYRTLIENMLKKNADERFSMLDVMKYLSTEAPEEAQEPKPAPAAVISEPAAPSVEAKPNSRWMVADDLD